MKWAIIYDHWLCNFVISAGGGGTEREGRWKTVFKSSPSHTGCRWLDGEFAVSVKLNPHRHLYPHWVLVILLSKFK